MRTGIALGSNLGDRIANLREARDRVLRLAGVSEPVLTSEVYETAPIDCAPDTPAYFNAVMEVAYDGHPALLLDALQGVERAMGRPDKRPRNASRPIDLDILYCGNFILNNEEVIIPHPRIPFRRFVLQPATDIAPDRILPGHHSTFRELLDALPPGDDVRPIGEKL
ncbi:MAG TPA: 2-amino-4-hydroxy-6-hydroxymethyldihydropteridine diphosphokinase [Chthoniobacterales bacterium]